VAQTGSPVEIGIGGTVREGGQTPSGSVLRESRMLASNASV